MFSQKPKKQESFGSKLFKSGVVTAGLGGLGYAGWKNRKRLGNIFNKPKVKSTITTPKINVDPTGDAYKYFGIDKAADKNTIKSKYNKMAKQYHPDRGGNIDDFKKLNTQYEVLRTHIGFSNFLGDYANF